MQKLLVVLEMTEPQMTRRVDEILTREAAWVCRALVGANMGHSGWPDRLYLPPLRQWHAHGEGQATLYVEWKKHPNKLSALQSQVLGTLRRRGCAAVCATLMPALRSWVFTDERGEMTGPTVALDEVRDGPHLAQLLLRSVRPTRRSLSGETTCEGPLVEVHDASATPQE